MLRVVNDVVAVPTRRKIVNVHCILIFCSFFAVPAYLIGTRVYSKLCHATIRLVLYSLFIMDNKEIDYKRAAEQLRKGEPRPLQNSSYNLPFLNIFVPL